MNSNNTYNNLDFNNSMPISCRLKYDKKRISKQSAKMTNKNKLLIKENYNNVPICDISRNANINSFNLNISHRAFCKINSNKIINNNLNRKNEKKFDKLKLIDEIICNRKSMQCLKRNQTERVPLNKVNNFKHKTGKNFFNKINGKIN